MILAFIAGVIIGMLAVLLGPLGTTEKERTK